MNERDELEKLEAQLEELREVSVPPCEGSEMLLALPMDRRGRPAKSGGLRMEVVRGMTAEDVQALNEAPRGNGPPAIGTLRHRHHQLAKLVADGAKGVEAAYITGYTPQRVYDLQNNDPAFMELVEYYKREKAELYVQTHKKLSVLADTAIEVIQERVEADSGEIGLSTLTEIVKMACDRSVAPSKVAQGGSGGGAAPVNLQVNFVAPRATGLVIEAKEER